MSQPYPVSEILSEHADLVEKMLHVLSIYPVLSPSMLQVGIGPNTSPSIWKPLLKQLIIDGFITEEEAYVDAPSGRTNSYTKLSLTTSS